jgi:hypothetical protein
MLIILAVKLTLNKDYLQKRTDITCLRNERMGTLRKILYLKSKTEVPPIIYYWTVPLILDHSYLVEILTSSKIADTKMSGF